MTINTSYSSFGLYGYSPPSPRGASGDLYSDPAEKMKARDEATVKAFREYMRMTPPQRIRQAILKELGLTEEELHAMPPEKQEAIEKEIAKRIRMKMVGQTEDANANGRPPLDQLSRL